MTIQQTLAMQDRMSPVLKTVTRALHSTLNAMRTIQGVELGAEFAEAAADVELAARAFDEFTSSANRTVNATNNVTNATENTVNATENLASEMHVVDDSIEQAAIATENLVNRMRRADNSIDEIGRNNAFPNLTSDIFLSQVAMKALNTSVNLVKKSIGGVIELTDKMTNSVARLNLVNDGLKTVIELQDDLFASAQRTRTSYQQVSDVVGKLGINAKKAFSGTEEIVYFTELMNKQFKIAGASISESSNAMYQLTQAMASGKLQGDEYRSIIENAPLLAQSIEKYIKSMGHAELSLKEMASEGLITSDVIRAALFSSATEIERKYSEMPMTIGEMWVSIQNEILRATIPFMEKIAESAQYIYENWDKIDDIAIPSIIGIATAASVTLVPAIIKTVASVLQLNIAVVAANVQLGLIVGTVAFLVMRFKAVATEGTILERVLYALSVAATAAAVAVLIFKRNLDIATMGVSALVGALVILAMNFFKVKDATDETADASALAMAEMEKYTKIINENSNALKTEEKTLDDTTDKFKDFTSSEYAAAYQAKVMSKKFNEVSKNGVANANMIKELSSNYNYLNQLVPRLEENLGKQNSKVVELMKNAHSMSDASLESASAWLNESNALSTLANDINNVTNSYYEFARAAAFVSAYQGKMQETATKIIEAEIEKSSIHEAQQKMRDTIAKEGMGFKSVVSGLGIMALEPKAEKLDETISAGEKEMLGYFESMQKYMGDVVKNQDKFSDKFSKVSTGNSIKTKNVEPLLNKEDIKMMMDIATEGYKVKYTQLTPSVAVNLYGDIRQEVDIDNVIDRLTDGIESVAKSDLREARG